MNTPADGEPSPTAEGAQRLVSAELVAGLVVAALALWLFTWLGEEVLEGEAFALDYSIRDMMPGVASPLLTRIMLAASRYGGPSILVPVGLAVALAFLIRGWRRGALLVVVTLTGAGLLNWLLKLSFGRVRPEAFFDYPLPGSPSFPSGHALYAASVFGGLAVLLSARLEHRSLRTAVWVLMGSLVLMVGFSRVYLGVHYPSDVLAGYAVGVIWVATVAVGDRLARHRRRRR